MLCYCCCCNEPSTCEIIDVGIGPYEYAGAPGNQKIEIIATTCCESIPYTDNSCDKEITMDDYRRYDP